VRILLLPILALGCALSGAAPAAKSPAKPAPKPAVKTAAKKTAAAKPTPKKKPTAASTARRRIPVRRTPPRPVITAEMRQAAFIEINERMDARSPVENSAALVPFFEQLHRVQSGGATQQPLRILQYGDSHTAADEWTGALRAAFQERFGDGGGGFSLAGRPFVTYRRLDLKTAQYGNWLTHGLLSPQGDGIYGLGGAAISTNLPGQTIALTAEARRVELFYWRQPGGGAINFIENGVPVETISTDGPAGPGYFEYMSTALDASQGPQRFELQTLDRLPVRLFGWVTEKDRGVTVEPLGINGAQANIFFRWDQPLWQDHLRRRSPGLIVLAYGTNDAGNSDWSFSSYKQAVVQVIQRIRAAAPAASILIVGPPDRLLVNRYQAIPYPRLEMISTALREAALDHQCAYWDLRERMGGPGAMRRWVLAGAAQGDYVHFTAPGYRLIGVTLFNDLMDHYAAFLRVRGKIFTPAAHGQTDDNSQDRSADLEKERDSRSR
jgi:lysophospholipase L1-like esterase